MPPTKKPKTTTKPKTAARTAKAPPVVNRDDDVAHLFATLYRPRRLAIIEGLAAQGPSSAEAIAARLSLPSGTSMRRDLESLWKNRQPLVHRADRDIYEITPLGRRAIEVLLAARAALS